MSYYDNIMKEKEEERARLFSERCALALNMAIRSLEWLVNIGHDTGKGGGRPEPGEFEAAMTQAQHVLDAVVPVNKESNYPIRFSGGEVPYTWDEFRELDSLIVAAIPKGVDFSFEYVTAYADMLTRCTVVKQILEMRDIGSRFRIPIEHGNTGTVIGYDPDGDDLYAVHLDGSNIFYFAREWEGEDTRVGSIQFLEE